MRQAGSEVRCFMAEVLKDASEAHTPCDASQQETTMSADPRLVRQV